jgi:uncharacterized protein YndB with AHSA1/START domain
MRRIPWCVHVAGWLIAASLPLAAAGEVADAGAGGFTSRNKLLVAAPPAEVFGALVRDVGKWWSSAHTFSGDAANLRIEARPQGCFCETLPGGGARHLTVVAVEPGKLLRLTGGLGPLQAMAVDGALSWELTPAADGTEITATYAVHGYAAGGLEAWAAPVDRVIRQQLERLGRYVETGSPEPAGEPDEPG